MQANRAVLNTKASATSSHAICMTPPVPLSLGRPRKFSRKVRRKIGSGLKQKTAGYLRAFGELKTFVALRRGPAVRLEGSRVCLQHFSTLDSNTMARRDPAAEEEEEEGG